MEIAIIHPPHHIPGDVQDPLAARFDSFINAAKLAGESGQTLNSPIVTINQNIPSVATQQGKVI